MSGKRKLEAFGFGGVEDHRAKKKVLQSASAEISCSSIEDENSHLTNPSDITSLLDFSGLTTPEDISSRFEAVAQELLCNSTLAVVRNGTRTDLEILELEFYLQKAGCHEDPFTHGSVEQERTGQWYFHRSPRRADTSQPGLPVTAAGSYRSGSRKGLDLTFGGPAAINVLRLSGASSIDDLVSRVWDYDIAALSPPTLERNTFMYLRRVNRSTSSSALPTVYRSPRIGLDLSNSETTNSITHPRVVFVVICGPSLLVDEVLRLSGASSIDDLVSRVWDQDIAALLPPRLERNTFMYLRRVNRNTSSSALPTVYRSPRIGLDLSNSETTDSITHPRVVFVGKLYRYFTRPELLVSKGRMQTFVGLYTTLRHSNGHTEDSLKLKRELCKIMGLKEQNVSKYLADYRSGYQDGELKSFVGPSGKGVCQSVSEYLKMMGTLHKALQ
ncbi:hypothetical protein PAXINDRAFT_181369 [Paxillus involutus ATCC 200175]|uniref:Uncharacterized protein n=1 Tax=Paxillus involutus ATCC 200175 TaxID=664439 RepID=A0A0C9TSS7_PAXIN|nr:hypothetical protein PAXINDRAFT_181369 [Paxillus involutus ATCC 200175]